ncbi:hypothetical protein NBRC3257_0630 [Gluconobacter thailandicus NBRC 3257]|uniref:Uncharacterized protein n=1 Tax=Gluconobacter thailandicus NBRC 3257 TaxID=1381097 RepID=A0ABQ0ITT8_GLUTH|nr:hypothetical protein NBRC3255_2587 [Gluconobacter thailandicus NBRC 3255]GAD25631.1 hypothetical protein NBRC3257_0630 [Gluconobacter thailandicus NBRC 3257]
MVARRGAPAFALFLGLGAASRLSFGTVLLPACYAGADF